MPIRIQAGTGSVVVDQTGFGNEAQLQDVLAEIPDLLRQGDEPALALVARELELPEAGILDLLFVSSATSSTNLRRASSAMRFARSKRIRRRTCSSDAGRPLAPTRGLVSRACWWPSTRPQRISRE